MEIEDVKFADSPLKIKFIDHGLNPYNNSGRDGLK